MNEQPKLENTFAATVNEQTDSISTSLDRPETEEERAVRMMQENQRKMAMDALKDPNKNLKKEDPESPQEEKE
jgi:hypothetical protein